MKAIPAAIVGVSEHGNSAELVTISANVELLDRRRIDLTGRDLPTHPYHHQGSWAVRRYKNSPWAQEITLPEAVALVEKVEKAAAQGAKKHLETLAENVPGNIEKITLRICPELPSSIEARIRDHRAQTVADTVMYRQALVTAAIARGWEVIWYDANLVFDQAQHILKCEDISRYLTQFGRSLGPPWRAKHKLAAAAAIVAAHL